MACKDKRKVWVDVKRHERRVLKCQNKPKKRTKAIPNKLKVKLPGIVKKRARPARPIATPPRSPPRSPPQRRRIHISPPRATLPRFTATPSPPPRATPPRRRRIHISPPRATPPRFSATPPPEHRATPPRRTPPRRTPPRRAPRRELRVTLQRQTFRKPHKKVSSVEPTYDDQPLSEIRQLREFKARPARKYASTWPGYY